MHDLGAVWRPVPADSACPRAGVFRAWALVGAAMYAVPLRVPRVFYVNSRLPPDRPGAPAGPPLHGARVRRILPAAREPENLYQARSWVTRVGYRASSLHVRRLLVPCRQREG
jgi:hypothetical protein